MSTKHYTSNTQNPIFTTCDLLNSHIDYPKIATTNNLDKIAKQYTKRVFPTTTQQVIHYKNAVNQCSHKAVNHKKAVTLLAIQCSQQYN